MGCLLEGGFRYDLPGSAALESGLTGLRRAVIVARVRFRSFGLQLGVPTPTPPDAREGLTHGRLGDVRNLCRSGDVPLLEENLEAHEETKIDSLEY